MNLAQGLPALGAHLHTQDGQRGVRFAVWAPEATAVVTSAILRTWPVRFAAMA